MAPDGAVRADRAAPALEHRLRAWADELPRSDRLLLLELLARAELGPPATPADADADIESVVHELLRPIVLDRRRFFDANAFEPAADGLVGRPPPPLLDGDDVDRFATLLGAVARGMAPVDTDSLRRLLASATPVGRRPA